MNSPSSMLPSTTTHSDANPDAGSSSYWAGAGGRGGELIDDSVSYANRDSVRYPDQMLSPTSAPPVPGFPANPQYDFAAPTPPPGARMRERTRSANDRPRTQRFSIARSIGFRGAGAFDPITGTYEDESYCGDDEEVKWYQTKWFFITAVILSLCLIGAAAAIGVVVSRANVSNAAGSSVLASTSTTSAATVATTAILPTTKAVVPAATTAAVPVVTQAANPAAVAATTAAVAPIVVAPTTTTDYTDYTPPTTTYVDPAPTTDYAPAPSTNAYTPPSTSSVTDGGATTATSAAAPAAPTTKATPTTTAGAGSGPASGTTPALKSAVPFR